MVLIDVCIKRKEMIEEIFEWIVKRIHANGHISLMELINEFQDEIIIDDHDIFSYWDVGWNIRDLYKLDQVRHGHCSNGFLNIPSPKIHYTPQYI